MSQNGTRVGDDHRCTRLRSERTARPSSVTDAKRSMTNRNVPAGVNPSAGTVNRLIEYRVTNAASDQ